MKIWIKGLAVAVMGLAATLAIAADADMEALSKALTKTFPGLQAKDIRPTPAEGLYEVNRGMSFGYVTKDAKFFLDGDLIDLERGESLTEASRKTMRLAELNSIGEGKMIIYPAKKQKHVMTVFTDIDCGYCRKLHNEMADYNAQGITVRYLFYPRSGPNTESFTKAEEVWCAKDRNVALTQAKQGNAVKSSKCDSPIMQHFQSGQRLGVRGTPALILDDGSMRPGYIPAARMAQEFAKLN